MAHVALVGAPLNLIKVTGRRDRYLPLSGFHSTVHTPSGAGGEADRDRVDPSVFPRPSRRSRRYEFHSDTHGLNEPGRPVPSDSGL